MPEGLYDIEDNVETKETGRYGKSLFAMRDFKKDEIVFVAFGPVVNMVTNYAIPIGRSLFIEPRIPKGNLCQYICHSCEPNLGIKNRTSFVAMKDIRRGEEVTINYGMMGYEYGDELPEEDRICKCGTPTCTGLLGCYKNFTDEEKQRYAGYISDYLLER
ncbi:MAG TPA: SET domain-containing protein-lysine N-methyltransferase [Candidatus Paceibacterota bacterium]|jgi:hypothetical protein|nr:SET domain-containing protein-lysine N-methyltransferase [Candidatus Paceibacterota bacterium]